MKRKLFRVLAALVLMSIACIDVSAQAVSQTTAFAYQGQLNAGGTLPTGLYQFTFTLYDASSGGSQVVGTPSIQRSIQVINGLFTTDLDFGQIFSGQRSARNSIAGPIGIAKQTAVAYKIEGWAGVVRLMGMLSLSLGILNLLPIPVLDGGVILLIFIEGVLGLVGMTMTMNFRERFQQVGFVLVLLLMGFVIVNDSAKVVEEWFNKPPAQEQQKK